MRKPSFEAVVLGGVVALVALIIVVTIADAKDMEAHHCRRTGDTRETVRTEFIYDGKGNIISSYPVWETEYLYACDDHGRWR